MIRTVIVYTIFIARVVIAARLLQLASRTVRNLYWLAGVFLANAAYYILSIVFLRDNEDLAHLAYTVGLTIAQLLVVMFIHTTFYQGRKSPFLNFLALSLVVGVVDTFLAVLAGPVVTLISVVVAINWGWHIVIAYRAYNEIADEKYVEDWVKARYKLMIAYCVMLAMTGFMLIGYLVSETLEAIQAVIGLFTLVGVVLQFLVWVMPERFRLFLNRNYHSEIMLDDQEMV